METFEILKEINRKLINFLIEAEILIKEYFAVGSNDLPYIEW